MRKVLYLVLVVILASCSNDEQFEIFKSDIESCKIEEVYTRSGNYGLQDIKEYMVYDGNANKLYNVELAIQWIQPSPLSPGMSIGPYDVSCSYSLECGPVYQLNMFKSRKIYDLIHK